MDSEWRNRRRMVPIAWLLGTILMSLAVGFCIHSNGLLAVFFGICSVICASGLLRHATKFQKRIRYVLNATLADDFSYKFPTDGISQDDMETNEMLNQIVEHLEILSSDAKQNEAFLAEIISLTDIGMVVADIKGDIRIHNEAALRLLDRLALTNICQITENSNDNIDIRKREVTVGDQSFTLLTITDLSRRMQEVEVESWEKLTRVLTHEIMNSLTPIQSISQTMSSKTSDTETSEAFATISSSSRTLMQFVRNFREFSRLPEPRMKSSYIKPILEHCVRMAESFASNIDIKISLTCFPPDLMVYTDESLLSQVLLNIMKNAIESNPKKINVEVYERKDESIEIRISNDGDPIPAEAIPHIFTPFFTTRSSGSGIGLSLSRRIITHLGGTLTFYTDSETTFCVRL